jgi:hypothetical protein
VDAKKPWPAVPDQVRDELAAAIDMAARKTRRSFDQLPLEDRLTGKFFGLLDGVDEVQTPSGTTAGFNYRTFDGTTEREVGADGAIILSVRHDGRTRKKSLLFQAKRLTGHESRTALRIRSLKERERLERQLGDLYEVAGPSGAIALFYTRAGFYAVDSGRLLDLADRDPSVLATPLVRKAYPWPIGLCIAQLALACEIGNTSPTLVRGIERDGLKSHARMRRSLRHRLEVKVQLKNPTGTPVGAPEEDDDAIEGEPMLPASHQPKLLPEPSRAFERDYRPFVEREEAVSLQGFLAGLFKGKPG